MKKLRITEKQLKDVKRTCIGARLALEELFKETKKKQQLFTSKIGR